MPARTKIEVVRTIQNCAALYKENLSGKNLLFVTTHNNSALCFETFFACQNFMHLTGVKSHLNSDHFFRAATSRRLSTKDITIPKDGTVDLKLDALPQLMNIHRSARMVGDYDNTKPLLITDKFAGTVTAAMGFVCINNFYMPNTALKKDVREITTQATRRKVAAIFVKYRHDAMYAKLTYIAKGVTVDDGILQKAIGDKVDLENLTADFPIP